MDTSRIGCRREGGKREGKRVGWWEGRNEVINGGERGLHTVKFCITHKFKFPFKPEFGHPFCFFMDIYFFPNLALCFDFAFEGSENQKPC